MSSSRSTGTGTWDRTLSDRTRGERRWHKSANWAHLLQLALATAQGVSVERRMAAKLMSPIPEPSPVHAGASPKRR